MDFILIFLFFWSFIHTVMTTENCFTTDLCLRKRNSGSLSLICNKPELRILQCASHQTIRITNTMIYKHRNNDRACGECSSQDRKEWTLRADDLMKIQHELYQSCSYQNNCSLNTDFIKPSGLWRKYLWYIVIHFCCVDQADIHDMCSELNEIVTSEAIYFAIRVDSTAQSSKAVQVTEQNQCFCLIHGDVNITLVEYMPCSYQCPEIPSVIYIDGESYWDDCESNCSGVVYLNSPVLGNSAPTNITLTGVHRDVMFWISVLATSTKENASVSCNLPLTSPSTLYVSSTTPSQSTIPSNNGSQTDTSPSFNGSQTDTSPSFNGSQTDTSPSFNGSQTDTSPSFNGSQTDTSPSFNGSQTVTSSTLVAVTYKANIFPVGAVAGGVIGSIVCVVIIVVTVFMFKRTRREKRSAEKGDQHNAVRFQSTPHSSTEAVRGGVVNNTYEASNESGFNRPLETSDDYSTSNDCVYDQPEDCIAPSAAVGRYAYGTEDNTKASSVVYANVNKPTNTHEEVTDDDTYSYAESYTNDDMEGDYSTTTGGRNVQKDTSTYDTFADFDTYSHIHAAGKDHMTPRSDNYSHLTLPTDRSRGGVTEAQENVYNHITLNAGNQGPCTKPSEPGNYST